VIQSRVRKDKQELMVPTDQTVRKDRRVRLDLMELLLKVRKVRQELTEPTDQTVRKARKVKQVQKENLDKQ
jgi:hypothetical protein